MNKLLLDIIILLCTLGIIASIAKERPTMIYFFLGAVFLPSLLKLGELLKGLTFKKKNNPGNPGPEITAKCLGKRIKKGRKGKNLTQEELAKKTGIAKATIPSIEQGRRFPSPEPLKRIAEVLEISVDELVK